MAPSETALLLERKQGELVWKREGEEEENVHVVFGPQNVQSEGSE